MDQMLEQAEHGGDCKCDLCKKFWLEVGPQSNGKGGWFIGPFSIEEYLEMGGELPEYAPEDEELIDEEEEVQEDLEQMLLGLRI